MEGSIHDPYKVLWADSYVLWNDKFASHILGDDEWNPERYDNKGKVVAFVDDVLVETETEEEYDEIVEEVLKRLEENDLYVKPEKYM